MEALFIPTEMDFQRWIKEAVKSCLAESLPIRPNFPETEEPLLNRREIAKVLRVSLVTLTDWKNRGLPCHKQRGRVYFLRSEVLSHIKANQMGAFKPSQRFSEIAKEDLK